MVLPSDTTETSLVLLASYAKITTWLLFKLFVINDVWKGSMRWKNCQHVNNSFHIIPVRKRRKMNQSAHAYMIKAPALLNDTRRLISRIDDYNRDGLSAISTSISAVEAFLNEIVQIGNGYKAHKHGLKNPLVRMAVDLEKAERKPILCKFDIAYRALKGSGFNVKVTKPIQRLQIVIDVRNELTHPKASTINISLNGISLQPKEKKLVNKLRSNGFKVSDDPFDWERVVNTKAFALWAYQSAIDSIAMVFDAWPYIDAIDSFKEIYSVNLRHEEQWK